MSEMTEAFVDFDRNRALDHTAEMIRQAWDSFDNPRPDQPFVEEEVRQMLSLPLPETGIGMEDALSEVEKILDQSISQPRPRYFAYVGSSGLEMGVLADAISASHDVNLAVYAGAATHLEQHALEWISDFVGFGGKHGMFTSGGMLSNLTALTAARQRAFPDCRKTGIRKDVAVYVSRDAHSSVARAVEILGLGSNSLRDVAIDENRRLRPDDLREMIEADLAAGVKPVAIVASAGTTLAGAVDPLDKIADLAEEFGIWLHVDGAYGGPAAAVEGSKPLFAGLDRTDSLTIDAHKWLFLPKPCGVMLVRDRKVLTDSFAHDASYILEEPEYKNSVDWTLEYSRPLRALKAWLSLRTYGAVQFRQAIGKNLEQAQLCKRLVNEAPNFDLILEPQLSTVLFRHHAADGNHNAHNRELARLIQADGRLFVAAANVDGADCLRVCFVNYRTTDDDVVALIEIVNELGQSLNAQK